MYEINKVSEKQACTLVSAFLEEIRHLRGFSDTPSFSFLTDANRLHATGHEARLGTTMEQYGLAANIKVSYVDVKMTHKHPVLHVRDYVEGLSAEGQVDTIFCGHDSSDYAGFWSKWRGVQPDHPVYDVHKHRLGSVVPVWLHADEGTGQKKRPLMVLQWQVLMGKGSSRKPDSSLNYLGNSVETRALFSVMSGRVYSKRSTKKRLMALTRVLAEDMGDAFENPIQVHHHGHAFEIFLCPLGLKGDWPALTKLGNLCRHHLRDTWTNPAGGAGICHYCKAGQKGHLWHDVSYKNMLVMREDCPPPWSTPPALIECIPHSLLQQSHFFRVDMFHLMLKGVLADVAANALAPRSFVVSHVPLF